MTDDRSHPVETISAWLDGEASPEEHALVEAHLASCAACRVLAEDLKRLARASAEETLPPVPGDLEARIAWRLRSEAKKARPGRWRSFLPLTAVASLAAVALLVVLVREQHLAPPISMSRPLPPASPEAAPNAQAPALQDLDRIGSESDASATARDREDLRRAHESGAGRPGAKEGGAIGLGGKEDRAADELRASKDSKAKQEDRAQFAPAPPAEPSAPERQRAAANEEKKTEAAPPPEIPENEPVAGARADHSHVLQEEAASAPAEKRGLAKAPASALLGRATALDCGETWVYPTWPLEGIPAQDLVALAPPDARVASTVEAGLPLLQVDVPAASYPALRDALKARGIRGFDPTLGPPQSADCVRLLFLRP